MQSGSHPERIGKYRIDRVLGEGAMGVVYKAHDLMLERDVAIKVVRTELLADDERDAYLTRFKREAQAAARLMHPNIIAVYDFADHEGAPYIAMEYVVGRSLRDVFREKGRLAPREAIFIVTQMLNALGAVHGLGVVHRDIKPANVMVVQNGIVKLADFGVARLSSSELTMNGSVVGTVGYMSPEQYKGEPVDNRSDLFAVGVVLYELMAGQKPFTGDNLPQMTFKACYEPARSLDELVPGLPAGLARLIDRALAKVPADRFHTAEIFNAALRQVIEPQPLQTSVASGSSGDSVRFEGGPATSSQGTSLREPGSTGSSSGFPKERLDAIERALAFHLGPIAKVMVKKAAAQSTSLDDLHARLAGHLPREAEKTAFLNAVRRS